FRLRLAVRANFGNTVFLIDVLLGRLLALRLRGCRRRLHRLGRGLRLVRRRLGRRLRARYLVELAILGRLARGRAQIEIGRHGKIAIDANLGLIGRGVLSRTQQILHLGLGAAGDGERRREAESEAKGLFHDSAVPFKRIYRFAGPPRLCGGWPSNWPRNRAFPWPPIWFCL